MSSGYETNIDNSDVEIIDYICGNVLPDYVINKELLLNWQFELSDSLNDYSNLSSVIEQDVILSIPFNSTPEVRYFENIIARVDQIDEEIYHDFKIIVLEIVISVTSVSYKTKIHLHRQNFHNFLIDKLLKLILDNAHSLDFNKPSIINQYIRLIIIFLELGCEMKQLRRLIHPLFNKNFKLIDKLILLELLNQIFMKFESHFNFYLFVQNFPIAIPFANDSNSSKSLTIQSWFKLNRVNNTNDDPVTLFVLASSTSSTSSTLKVQLINYNQFLIEIKNNLNGSRMQFSFNQILNISDNSNQGFTHFTLTYDNYTNLNLFVDGEYSESIPCPEIRKLLNSWNKVYIGNNEGLISNNDELLIKNLTILNIHLSYEWINLLYNLGLGYDWDFKEFTNENLLNLLNHLSFRGLTNVGLKIKELKKNEKRENNDLLNKSSLTSLHKLKYDLSQTNLIDKNLIVDFLSSGKIKQDNILFDTDNCSISIIEELPNKILIHHSNSIHGAFYTIGGSSLLLNLIESSTEINDSQFRDTIIYKSLTLLFTILNNNWRLNKEFENSNGYGILSILLSKYKENFNKSLTFNLMNDIDNNKSMEITGCHGSNLLNLILNHTGYDFINPYESIIINSTAYRFLILNFELFFESDSFEYLLYQFQILIHGSKLNSFNNFELNRMKLLKKILQFLKSPVLLNHKPSSSIADQLSLTLKSIIKADTSVEIIRSISLYIIYSLYNPDCSVDFGIITLQSLTEILCDPNSSIKVLKKFSRSITIHWILLIFNFKNSKDVVICGIRLLSKLLKILGPHIIKRFFQINHGLDILTQFLKDWWDDDEIICSIFLSSFGIVLVDDDDNNLVSIISKKPSNLNQLLMPEFLILLNNLVLNSMCTLSYKSGKSISSNPSSPTKPSSEENLTISLNVLHLINQYTDSIEVGFENNTQLRQLYKKKEWLDGIFELLGYLRLSLNWSTIENFRNFNLCYEKLINILTNMFISSLSNGFFEIFESLSDITKKLILELIFPKIFEHINQFINVSNFIFNEEKFLDRTVNLLNYYFNEFLKQNYYINQENLDNFITCILSTIETSNNQHHGLKKLINSLGDLIKLKFLKLDDEADRSRKLIESVKILLYRQITILQGDVFDDRKLSELIILILGNFFRLAPNDQKLSIEYILNFLRTCYIMNQNHFSSIIHLIDKDSSELILDFFENLITKNDEETLIRLQKFPTFSKIINKNYQILIGNYKEIEFLNVFDMISVMLTNGGKLGYLNNIYIKSFEKDCEQLKLSIINGELIKFNRSVQDRQENIQFFTSIYNSIKLETSRLVYQDDLKSHYILDYIENSDRMRKRLIVEEQLSDSEKLSYNINIPIKQVDSIDRSSLQDFNYIIGNSGIDTLSLSTNDSFLDINDDSFEIIDENTESQESEISTSYEDKNRKVIRSLFMGDQIVALWNISQINGLVPIESLMILGSGYLYLIENYFHCTDGNVIDAHDAPSELRDPYLQLINSQSSNILKNDNRSHRNKNWSLDKLSCISKRQFLLRDIALEMFFSDGASILITCLSTKERDSVYNKLSSFASGKGLDYDLTQALQLSSSLTSNHAIANSTSFFTSKLASAFSPSSMSSLLTATKKWRMGEMSNFYYLMIINTLAGRTFNDLTQYPVFPWIIADYTSNKLDFTNSKTFRDLSKPMGAQTSERAKQFQERFEALDSLYDHDSPPFHYGTHYSSAMIVTSFLIRLKPYVQSYLLLQGGKFDHADRLFNSIERAWNSASKDNTTDVRELTPEFFYLPAFLTNSNHFEFGTLQSGKSSNDVELPPWANGDPKIFIAKNREALESPYVSANLHLWIELIFGHKQSGPEAVKSLNVFHHLSYNGAINLDNINDEVEKRAVIGMINNFGQTPMKSFHKPHPMKEVLNLPNFYLTSVDINKPPKLVFESKLKQQIYKLEISSKNKKWIGRPPGVSSEDDLLIRKGNNFKRSSGSLIINQTTFLNIHSSNIASILQIGHKLFLTGSEDGILNVWKCNLKPSTNLQFQCILRGHFASIKTLKFSKSFKVGISVDDDGILIVWDLTRFKFIRKISPPSFEEKFNVLASISNETGNIGIIYSTKTSNILKIYTVNGEVLITKNLKTNTPTCLAFGSNNDTMVDNGKHSIKNNHTYWSNEIIVIAYGKSIDILELVPENIWNLIEIDSLCLNEFLTGYITALELLKQNEVDADDKLCRGYLRLVLGDSTGRVYEW